MSIRKLPARTMYNKTYFELLELVEQQQETIKAKDETISKLININVEQENMINTIWSEGFKE